MDALDAGCDVMIFSDNMPVEQEITLKDIAAERGLLVMGPDCGTAVVGGGGLGFARTVAPGGIGLVAPSRTRAPPGLSPLDAARAGGGAALRGGGPGPFARGGRPRPAGGGGGRARPPLAAPAGAPATGLLIVTPNPPAPRVAGALRASAGALPTPVQFAFAALGEPDLPAATEAALAAVSKPVP